MAKMEIPLTFQLVVAATKQMGIGKAGKMPWKLPKDMAHFKNITTATSKPGRQNAVIMGRKTWESIPSKFRPLPGRLNIVLSRSQGLDTENGGTSAQNGLHAKDWLQEARKQGVRLLPSLEAAMEELSSAQQRDTIEAVYVIGGGQIYKEAVNSPQCSAIHLTEIANEFECDTFFPPIDKEKWRLWSSTKPQKDGDTKVSFQCYVPASQSTFQQLPTAVLRRHEEYQYLDLIEDVMENGVLREDRTGTGTLSNFGCQMRFNLRHSFPLLTTKRVFWRGVAEELLWFLRGDTNAKSLKDKDIHIWDGNSSRAYLDSIGLKDREENDLGPVYGFQWRHFGADYKDMHTDYANQGVDQLSQVVDKLKNNPTDRRIILSAWNPAAMSQMALPPCHMFAQFYVANKELSCQMYQRSADLGLGVPFNIASYALLTYLLAKVCDLEVGDLVHVLGDAHVYVNHVDPLKLQLKNQPRPFPDELPMRTFKSISPKHLTSLGHTSEKLTPCYSQTLNLKRKRDRVEDYTMDDLELIGYNPHKKIAMQMAV